LERRPKQKIKNNIEVQLLGKIRRAKGKKK